jgi:hypothetical protein
MNKQKKILELELEKHKKLYDHYLEKLSRYQKINSKIDNVISQDEIGDLQIKADTAAIEIEILQAKIELIDEP